MATYNKAHLCKRIGHDWAFERRACNRCELFQEDIYIWGRRTAIWNAGQRQAAKAKYGTNYLFHVRQGPDGRIAGHTEYRWTQGTGARHLQ